MIFDTSILIYASRGYEKAKELIIETEKRAISAVTYMEFVPHCRNKRELQHFEKMLEALHFTIYEIDNQISIAARGYTKQYALSHSVEMGDALIAATGLRYNETVCTTNIKHFKPIPSLNLEPFKI
ncbi:type II toxin-antitoxin system VapC family toxin [Zooshikella marina]|uniref:type II toxin-antitoxin system VapC family toxin n=1 Tax=Zooshikella ganghwensis TaxID=202772 RepID=UPI001BAF9379|nr:type II toxin-antitoxin system VapC family toxin [Zooshikella ganghwensis]MBU2708588.1 type II toxin-antitoxin system VapC family toxin [Zooshikella ganghwensis]